MSAKVSVKGAGEPRSRRLERPGEPLFLDSPQSKRPIPSSHLVFYLEECGFGRIEVHRLSPAIESMPSVATLPEDFRQTFFGGLDYAIIARRL